MKHFIGQATKPPYIPPEDGDFRIEYESIFLYMNRTILSSSMQGDKDVPSSVPYLPCSMRLIFILNLFTACDNGHFGHRCLNQCPCNLTRMSGGCHHESGACYCEPGYTGDWCNISRLFSSNYCAKSPQDTVKPYVCVECLGEKRP